MEVCLEILRDQLFSSQKILNLLPGATRVCCLATAAAKVERWLRWLTVSLISLLPVVDDPASLDVSLPCRFHNSSASCKISERIDQLSKCLPRPTEKVRLHSCIACINNFAQLWFFFNVNPGVCAFYQTPSQSGFSKNRYIHFF